MKYPPLPITSSRMLMLMGLLLSIMAPKAWATYLSDITLTGTLHVVNTTSERDNIEDIINGVTTIDGKTVQAGDTIELGNFSNFPGFDVTTANLTIYAKDAPTSDNGGTSNDPTDDGYKSNTVVTGNVTLSADGVTLYGIMFDDVRLNVYADDCRIRRCIFDDYSTNEGFNTYVSKTSSPVAPADNTEFAYNEFRHSKGIGIRVNAGSTNTKIFRNYFHDFTANSGSGNVHEAIGFGTGTPTQDEAMYGVIEYNFILRSAHDAEAISIKSSYNTIQYNHILDCTDETITFNGSNYNIPNANKNGSINNRFGRYNIYLGNNVENSGGYYISDEFTEWYGNKTTSGSGMRIKHGVYTRSDTVPSGGSKYLRVSDTDLKGNDFSAIHIGFEFSSVTYNYNTLNTDIDGDNGATPTYENSTDQSETNTSASLSYSPIPTPIELDDTDVGPGYYPSGGGGGSSSIPYDETVVLKNMKNGKYVGLSGGIAYADQTLLADAEAFRVIDNGDGTVSLKAIIDGGNNFLYVDDSNSLDRLKADGGEATDEEVFTWADATEAGYFVLKSDATGSTKFVFQHNAGSNDLRGDGASEGDEDRWEYTIVSVGADYTSEGYIDFSAVDTWSTHYLTSGQGGSLGTATDSDEDSPTDGENETLTVSDNGWPTMEFSYDVTADSVLSVEVNSSDVGEILAVGVDEDNTHDTGGTPDSNGIVFQLSGTATYAKANSDYDNYSSSVGARRYLLPLDSISGTTIDQLIFIVDDDADASGEAEFTNVKVVEALMVDNFDEAGSSTWSNAIGSGTWSDATEDGNDQFELTSPSGGSDILNNLQVYGDTVAGTADWELNVQAHVDNNSGSSWDDFAVVFGYEDTSNYYVCNFNESDDGAGGKTSGLIEIASGSDTELLDWDAAGNGGLSNGFNDIQIIKEGDDFTVYLNGEDLGTVTISGFPTGNVKFGVGSKNDPSTFDNFIVH